MIAQSQQISRWNDIIKLLALVCFFSYLIGSVFGQAVSIKQSVWRKIDTENISGDENIRFITPGFKERVWITYNASDEVSGTDGYEVTNIPVTSSWRRRLYESRTGQLWTSNTQEILLYKNNVWESHDMNNPQLEVPVPILGILPTEYNKVLVLHSQALVERDVQSNETINLLNSIDTKLGPFIDIRLAKDEGAWIIANKGLARVNPPLRNLQRRFTPEIIPLPPDFPYELDRSFVEIEPGLVLVQGIVKRSANGDLPANSNHLLSWNGDEWKILMRDFSDWSQILSSDMREMILDEKFISPEKVEQANNDQWESIKINDVALMADGLLMIATDNGVYKECSSLWSKYSDTECLYVLDYDIPGDSLFLITEKGIEKFSLSQKGSVANLNWPESLLESDVGNAHVEVRNLNNKISIIQVDEQSFLFDVENFSWMDSQQLLPKPTSKIVFSTLCNEGEIYLMQIDSDDQFSPYTLWGIDSGIAHKLLAGIPNYVVGQSKIIDMERTDSNQVWIATSDGLYFYDNEQWEFFGYSANSFQSSVSEISILDRGFPIFATGEGIVEFIGSSFSHVLKTQTPVKSIFKSQNGVLWASSEDEVYSYIESTWIPFSFSDSSGGLKINSISEDSKNRIWLSTEGGVYAYSPSADYDAPNTFIPNKTQEFSPSRSGNISIEIDGIDKWRHSLPENIFFSYKLDENDWSQFSKNRSLKLQNLSGGEHTLMVRSMDGNGNIDFSPDTWNFNLKIPWHYDSRVLTMVFITSFSLLFLSWMAIDRHRNLKKSYKDVEKIVKERTLQLEKANEQLLMHKKMRAMGALASGIAHDFNSILSIVQGSANIIKSNIGNPEKIEKRVDRIETVVKQGTTLVRAMLGFARDRKILLSKVDLSKVVHSTLEILNDRTPKSIKIDLDIEESLPLVRGNEEYLQQILVNLLLNAFDALDNVGSIVIQASKEPTKSESSHFKALKPDPGLEYVYLNITDYGAGIKPSNLERIFEPFFTTKALSTKKGTGLGLSMVYELAQQLELGLSVGSKEKEHTNFCLQLPVYNETRMGNLDSL